MLKTYISQLDYTSLKDDKIEAKQVPVDGLTCYIYYDYSKQLHFIIKSEEEISENRKGIKVKKSILDLIGYGKNSFIDLICTHTDFENEFIQIIEQIIDHFNQSKNIIKAIKVIIGKWYYFLGKAGSIDLSESDIKGIIGELLFIKESASKIEKKIIIDAWKGSESGIRDFNFESFDVEVKASSKEIGHVHTINGQIQLKSDLVPLFVYSVSLKKSDSKNALTLEKLINEICLDIGDDSFLLHDFFEKLEKVNVLASEADKYNSYSYELRNILTVEITEKNLNNFLVYNENIRISNLKYDFDFNGLDNTDIQFS
jgi:hypothetical protein